MRKRAVFFKDLNAFDYQSVYNGTIQWNLAEFRSTRRLRFYGFTASGQRQLCLPNNGSLGLRDKYQRKAELL